jgi:hypothetical protein
VKTMEHRCSARVPTTAKVLIYQNTIPVALCRTNDIGMGGMFLKYSGIIYPKNTLLELEFNLATESGVKLFHVPACVVHGANEGLGLMFLKSDTVLCGTIRKMLLNNIKSPQQDDLLPFPAEA